MCHNVLSEGIDGDKQQNKYKKTEELQSYKAPGSINMEPDKRAQERLTIDDIGVNREGLMMDQVAEVERFDDVVVDASVKIHHNDQLEDNR